MSVSSPCEICGRADVDHACNRCGNLVCAKHFDRESGMCVECTAEVGIGDTDPNPSQEDMPDGVDTYRS